METARGLGALAVPRGEAEGAVAAFSQGMGCDIVLICADTPSDDPIALAGDLARDRARVVVIGAVGMDIPRKTYYEKELSLIVSRSYGPGRYDPVYEEAGVDYPKGYVRWTEGRNLQAVVELIAEGGLDAAALVSHRFPIDRANEAYDLITGESDQPFLGVLLTYPLEAPEPVAGMRRIALEDRPIKPSTAVRLGALGAGNFATAVMFPTIRKVKDVEFVGLATATGLKSAHVGKRFGFHYATTDETEIFSDEQVNTVAILTRHHQHGSQVVAALKAGKHVFCEKPLALDRETLIDVAQALKASERMLMVGFNRRFAPLAVGMKSFLEGVREPKLMSYRVNAGFLPDGHWIHDPAQGGGRIIGEACHFIDFLTYIVGTTPSRVSTLGLPDLDRYNEDNVVITLEFPEGSKGTIMYLASGDPTFPKERIEVFGGGRVAVLDDFRRLETIAAGRQRMHRTFLRQDKGHRSEWKLFVRAIIEGGPPPIPYEHLFDVTLASFAAVESLRKGKPVTLTSLSEP